MDENVPLISAYIFVNVTQLLITRSSIYVKKFRSAKNMDSAQRQSAYVAIKFQNISQYCKIELNNLTRETFFTDGKKR